MARPKEKVTKTRMNISISEEHKFFLATVANRRSISMSQLVEELAMKEYKRDCKQRGIIPVPYDGEQTRLHDT